MSDKLPLARRSSAVDSFASREHDTVEVPNPYDWLEDTTSAETQTFVEAQNARTTEYLNDPSLAEAKTRLSETLRATWGVTTMPFLPRSVGDSFLFRVLGGGREFGVTYRVPKGKIVNAERKSAAVAAAEEEEQEEPEIFYDEATHGSLLMASSPSRTGKYWAFQTSDRGSDWGVIRVKDVETGAILADKVTGMRFTAKPSTNIPWLGDRGFFYPYYPGGGPERGKTGETAAPPQLRFHEIGRPQEEDEVVHEDKENPWNTFKASVSQDDRFVFLEVYAKSRGSQVWSAAVQKEEESERNGGHGSSHHHGRRRLNLKFEEKVVPDFDIECEYIGTIPDQTSSSDGAVHLFWTSADNGKVMGYTPGASELKEIVPPHSEQTLKLARTLPGGNILVVRSIDVRDQIHIFSSHTGRQVATLSDVDVPVWTIYDVSHDPATGAVFLVEFSFCYAPRVWRAHVLEELAEAQTTVTVSGFKPVEIFPKKRKPETTTITARPPPLPPLSTRQVFYTSADGTRVPMFLTSAIEARHEHDSDNAVPNTTTPWSGPVLLYIYGGFGISVVPHFRADFVAFIRAFHGTVAVANVRGGGEYGRRWHEAGIRTRRQALLDDVLAAAMYLRNSGAHRVILMGESMGALNAAAAMVQAPNWLFDAVLLNAGPLDVLHRRRLGLGDRGAADLGDVYDPDDFDVLYRWTPLDKILPSATPDTSTNKIFPSVLLTAGDKDDLVSFSHSCKAAAALQYASAADDTADKARTHPQSITHLRITRNLGHMGNISAREKAAISLERWLWLKKTLGLEAY